MSLLDVRNLTLRFKGLVAVNAVDVEVQEGSIAAVIGPNGAGKTSLFNAVTGIYEPTEGVVALRGVDLQTRPTAGMVARWILSGVALGVMLFLLVCDVNQMWSAVVKANYTTSGGFDAAGAWQNLKDFVAAHPRVEARLGKFTVITHTGEAPFGASKTREEAEIKRAALPEMAALPADGSSLREEEGRFLITSADGARVFDRAPTREAALARLAAARSVTEQAPRARTKRLLVLLLGTVVGAAGAWAVFRQTRRTPTSVANCGIARTFQNIRLFQDMTVLENVLVGMDRHLIAPAGRPLAARLRDGAPGAGLVVLWALFWAGLRFTLLPAAGVGVLLIGLFLAALLWALTIVRRGAFTAAGLEVEKRGAAAAMEWISFVGLAERAHDLSKNLPYGDQRRLEIARALATKPTLLLLDEPAAGMNPSETGDLVALIRRIRDKGVTVLLIEHHMSLVMALSDHITVLDYGRKIAEGTPEQVQKDPKVIAAYLGTDVAEAAHA